MVSCNSSQGTEPQATTPEVTTPEVTTPEATTPEEITTPEETTPEETSPEETTPAWQAGLTPDGKLKLTHVTITAGDSPAELTAVSELTAYLEKRSITVSEGGFPIDIIGNYGMQKGIYNDSTKSLDIEEAKVPCDKESVDARVTALRKKYGFTEYSGDNVQYHDSGCITRSEEHTSELQSQL